MSAINPLNIAKLLLDIYTSLNHVESPVTEEKKELAEKLQGFLNNWSNILQCGDVEWSEDSDLNFDDNAEDHTASVVNFEDDIEEESLLEEEGIESQSQSQSQPVSSGSEYFPSQPASKKVEYVPFRYKHDCIAYWKSGPDGSKRKVKFVVNRFKLLKDDRNMIYQWDTHVDKMGSRIDKLVRIHENMIEKFRHAKEKRLIIHDIDLRRWAMQANAEIKLVNFSASDTFLLKFRAQNQIVSRKITKFVARNSVDERIDLAANASYFRSLVQMKVSELPDPSQLYNADQSGFQKEMHYGRTLDVRGVRTVEAVAQSVSATTHSYTIMPLVAATGELMKPLFICFQEQDGKLGPIKTDRLQEVLSDEVHIVASKSGKMTKDLFLDEWYSNCCLPNLPGRSVLLLDSFPAHKDSEALAQITPKDYNVDIQIIPAGTTGMAQPLDVYFFRLYKNFFRRVTGRITLDELPIEVFQRNNLIKMQTLIHSQFRSPRYKDVIKYSFFKSGYISERPPSFLTPVQFSFNSKSFAKSCDDCQEFHFLRCGWCRKSLCFNCFWTKHHRCENYVE